MSLKTFTTAYIEAALWSSVAYGAPEDDGSETWDTSFQGYGCDASDLAPEALTSIEADCKDFYEANYGKLIYPDSRGDYSDDERAGHDFWLTRNRHGAGFWDRGMDHGDELTEAAHAYGECDLYLGNDGLIYIS